jgi:hypothetical protein
MLKLKTHSGFHDLSFTGACANEIIPSIIRSFVYKAKEGRDVRIFHRYCSLLISQVTQLPAYNSLGILHLDFELSHLIMVFLRLTKQLNKM